MASVDRPFLAIGMDVGSTTVKATVVDPASKAILWSDYQRHHTKQPEKVLELLETILAAFPDKTPDDFRIFLTGSGSAPLAPSTGGKFVQEVNAVTLAVEHLHPDVLSVIELGGQDAKIIMFKADEKTGEKTAMASMNDKCASGTGATIDKCFLKVNAPPELVTTLRFDDSKLHHVAAKCGVFAETDIVNLIKSGIPSTEVLCSLADAIVMQNLSVLTRGNTLKARVLLLGGPNTYLPFLQDCWRLRIPQVWQERGYDYPKDVPIEELVFVPENAQYYAALGAVLYECLVGEPPPPSAADLWKPGKRAPSSFALRVRVEGDAEPPRGDSGVHPASRRMTSAAPVEAAEVEVPDAWRAIIEKALAKRPEDRFQDARALLSAVRALRSQTSAAPAPPAPPAPGASSSK